MKRLTLNEARLLVARNVVEQEELRKRWSDASATEAFSTKSLWEACERRNKRVLEALASDPRLRHYMWCWMVDINGEQEPIWVTEDRDPSPKELRRSILALNSLSQQVKEAIEHAGFCITDSGSGCGGWDLGVPCNDEEAGRLCVLLHAEFQNHLDAEVLDVRLRFWGWHIEGVSNLNDAQQLLKN